MGKAEQRQAKLSFDGGRRKGGTPGPPAGEAQMEEGSSDTSVRSMFLDLKSSLAGIDAKLDHLTEQMDRIYPCCTCLLCRLCFVGWFVLAMFAPM
ncbi:hypothetical protein NDU88_005204 [Pleurodeles waltl]|uniref:Uncharacterized protein n=1 Tax=Pleurodeles waltl TaxID=8319 RepID=A0AAV7UHW7_PLEWA|nr:hypothetical protein NDU88_005204 [Pleurodeles waltl]